MSGAEARCPLVKAMLLSVVPMVWRLIAAERRADSLTRAQLTLSWCSAGAQLALSWRSTALSWR